MNVQISDFEYTDLIRDLDDNELEVLVGGISIIPPNIIPASIIPVVDAADDVIDLVEEEVRELLTRFD